MTSASSFCIFALRLIYLGTRCEFYNNGQRMPNIFERARAYDNWNEENFQPQEDGYGSISDKYNDYKEVYNQLTDEEKSLSYRYPFLAVKIKENREKAFRATNHFDGITDGYGDAVRHCYWCALNQVSARLNSPNAKNLEMHMRVHQTTILMPE